MIPLKDTDIDYRLGDPDLMLESIIFALSYDR